ncbi:antitoxin Xre/MbcA/ParS toxin-binding domain-containing protein [Pseudocolwellia sp. HL-MZ19]|uniref:antitoxin Xre/MbcA/ParS toxin-binding domain-containing protein n=1 Tax=Pseudocolwellia sp. HL-MZ19 TaxID=3400846 RepID=UPI003CE7BEE7
MKLTNITTSNVKKVEDSLYLELPNNVINELSICESDTFIVTVSKGKMQLMVYSNTDIPAVIYNELLSFFKADEAIIAKWLQTPKNLLENKAPIEFLNSECGIETILDLINRMKTGDLS